MLPTPVADGIAQNVSDALVLPQLIPYFRLHAPGVALQSYYVKRTEHGRNMARGEIDVALLRHGCEHSIMLRVQHFRVAAAIV
jgi:hypothetical protein